MLGVSGFLAAAAEAPAGYLMAQSQLQAAGVVHGILRYTAWPRPRDPLRLCVSRSAPDAGELKRQLPAAVHGRALLVVLVEEGALRTWDCDAVFLDGWAPDSVRESLRAMAGTPVLTIGRGAEFCTDGGMFCLQALRGGTSFEVNLHALSLSGLRVHPQVLRLARPPQRGS